LSAIAVELRQLDQKRKTDTIVQQAIEKIKRPLRQIDSAIEFVNLARQHPDAVERTLRRTNSRNAVSLAIAGFRKAHPSSPLRVVIDDANVGKEGTNRPILYVRAQEDLLVQAFFNIIKNAQEAEAQVLRVRLRRSRLFDGNVDIVFTNDGHELTTEQQQNCFKPGWSTKEQSDWRSNTGMGLYMARKIVAMHRGTITLANLPEHSGVELLISLPAARQAR
jgi:signal transduction histidine kinase